MGGTDGGPPSRTCNRCEKFEVRESHTSLCLICRRTYQLGNTVVQLFLKAAEGHALKFLDQAFGWLEETLKEAQDIERGKGSEGVAPRSTSVAPSAAAEAPLKRKIVDSPPARSKPSEETARIENCPSAPDSKPKPSETSRPSSSSRGVPSVPSRVLPPPKAPPILTPAKAKGSVALVENSQVPAPKPTKRDPERKSGEPAKPLRLASKSKAEPSKNGPDPEAEAEEAAPDKPVRSDKKKKRESSSVSPSEKSKRGRREDREKEKKKRKRKHLSSSGSSSVTGPRVRESKRKERKSRPLTPPRPSPHTPPGPPPPPLPPPLPPPSPPPAPKRGWVGPIPYSSHPKWFVGKNKGITRRAKQELRDRQWR